MDKKIKIIDNFFQKEDLDTLSSIKLDDIKNDLIKTYHNVIDSKNVIKKSCIDLDLIKNIHKNYHQKVFEILKKLNFEKSKIYDYSDLTIINTGKNYKYPIHDDTPNKLLSGVIYLYPKENSGTVFYGNRKGEDKNIINWKQNRAVFFSRIERETWHSFKGNGISNRIVLVYNLMTYDVKKVFEIEKKNYFYGNLRWKLNPYLYEYLKFSL